MNMHLNWHFISVVIAIVYFVSIAYSTSLAAPRNGLSWSNEANLDPPWLTDSIHSFRASERELHPREEVLRGGGDLFTAKLSRIPGEQDDLTEEQPGTMAIDAEEEYHDKANENVEEEDSPKGPSYGCDGKLDCGRLDTDRESDTSISDMIDSRPDLASANASMQLNIPDDEGSWGDDMKTPLDEGQGGPSGGGFPGCGRAPLNRVSQGYIINGDRINYGEFPQYVLVNIRKSAEKSFLCGGTLVSDRHILTAAHCVTESNRPVPISVITVVFGEYQLDVVDSEEVQLPIANLCVSPKYNDEETRFDMAILTLRGPIRFNNYVQPACLPRPKELIATHGPESVCFLVGAGAVKVMQTPDKRPMPVRSNFVNKHRAVNVPCVKSGFGPIDIDRVCYTGIGGDSCAGDSGGPLLCLNEMNRWTLMASVSYGPEFCQQNDPATYARIRTLLNYMEQTCGVNLLG